MWSDIVNSLHVCQKRDGEMKRKHADSMTAVSPVKIDPRKFVTIDKTHFLFNQVGNACITDK